jgi:putative hydrolase of the HAD superfamily
MGVYRPFDPCVMSCRVGFRKPQREVYLKAAEMAGLKLQECLLVDDLVGNIEGARRAGMPGIAFSDAAGLRRELARWRLLG